MTETKGSFNGLSLRFEGKISKGKFEFTCVCGKYSGFDKMLNERDQTVVCGQCGTEYKFVQQKTHYHLFITPSNKPKSLLGKVLEEIKIFNKSEVFGIAVNAASIASFEGGKLKIILDDLVYKDSENFIPLESLTEKDTNPVEQEIKRLVEKKLGMEAEIKVYYEYFGK